MGKQILSIAVIISAVLISCSKEKIEKQQANQSIETVSGSITLRPSIDPLTVGLLGCYQFNGNLKDSTGKLADAVSSIGRVAYTTDRKGAVGKAIQFNQAYGLNIFAVPLDSNMSISVWVKNEAYPTGWAVPLIGSNFSFSLTQSLNNYSAAFWSDVPTPVLSTGIIDNKWHHIVLTHDPHSLILFMDGKLTASIPMSSGTLPSSASDYTIGWGFNGGYQYWKGAMDDLRFYKRVLSAVDITKLKQL